MVMLKLETTGTILIKERKIKMTGYLIRQKGNNNAILFNTLNAAREYINQICKHIGDNSDNYEIFEMGKKIENENISIKRVSRLPADNEGLS
jgi:hypothetical protein